VSGFSNLNELLVNNNATFITSLNVSGFTTLNNKTTLLSSLNVSGFTNLNNTTNINGSLYISGYNVLETLNSYSTSLSTLSNFRSDNESALITQESTTFSTLIHGVQPGSEIKFNTVLSTSNVLTQQNGTEYLTKIDSNGKLNVYHKYNEILPLKPSEYWVVHDELEKILIQAQVNVLKFVAHDLELDRIGLLAGGTAASLAAVIAVLGLTSVISAFLGGGGGDPPAPIDVFAINMQLNENKNNLNN
jgi:hypothetical protein